MNQQEPKSSSDSLQSAEEKLAALFMAVEDYERQYAELKQRKEEMLASEVAALLRQKDTLSFEIDSSHAEHTRLKEEIAREEDALLKARKALRTIEERALHKTDLVDNRLQSSAQPDSIIADAENRASVIVNSAQVKVEQLLAEAQKNAEEVLDAANEEYHRFLHKEEEIRKVEESLNRRTEDLDRKEQELEQRSKTLSEKEGELSHSTAELQEREKALKSDEEVMREEEDHIRKKRQELAINAGKWAKELTDSEERKLQVLRAENDVARSSIAEAFKAQRTAVFELNKAKNNLKTVCADLENRRKDLVKANKGLRAVNADLNAARAELKKITAASESVQKKVSTLKDRERNLTVEIKKLEPKRNDLDQREAQLLHKEKLVENQLKLAADMQKRALILEEKKKFNDHQRRRLKALKEEIEEAEQDSRPYQERRKMLALEIKSREQELFIRRQAAKIEALKRTRAGKRSPVVRISHKPAKGLSKKEIAAWLLSATDKSSKWEIPDCAVVIGSSPYEKSQFISFVERMGIRSVKAGDKKADCMIVGRNDWAGRDLERHLAARDGDILRIFSQELFIAAIIARADPFAVKDQKVLMRLAEGHPALEYLTQTDMEWPSIDCDQFPDEGSVCRELKVDETPLHMDGYYAGKTCGLTDAERRDVLSLFYEVTDVLAMTGFKKEYKAEWGKPGTTRRLWRMAHHLAWLVNTRKGIMGQQFAVADWSRDLEWLKKKYLLPRMRFRWPDIKMR